MAHRGQYGGEDDMMEDADEAQPQRVRSQVVPRKQKGRGFRERMDTDGDRNGRYESLDTGTGPGPTKCNLLILPSKPELAACRLRCRTIEAVVVMEHERSVAKPPRMICLRHLPPNCICIPFWWKLCHSHLFKL